MTEQEKKEFINKYLVKANTLDIFYNIIDDYEINVFTKDVRNVKTGHTISWIESGNSSLGKRIELMKKSGISSSFPEVSVRKAIRKKYGI